ncbi:MAG TPA: SprT-like domain-containing protein [Gemmatimonadaceae bacterium]|nr:SprT-like domain-containing protein [Gemmatimonadaceae bacterium]
MTRLLRGTSDPSQLPLDLEISPPRDADGLLALLRELGLARITRCRLTHNRNVMVSFGAGELRVHQGYLGAPLPVLRAIVTFVEGRTRAERRAAQRTIVAYPIRSPRPIARRDRTHSDDAEIAVKLGAWHERYNSRYFHGRLKHVPIRVSRRMKSRLGHYTASTPGGEPAEIAISRAHLRKHGWDETLHTLLHEMVHQWQDETGRTIDHGATFRAKAREVGIAPYARRVLATRPGRAEGSQTLGRRAARDG